MTTHDLINVLEQAITERNNERGIGGAAAVARLLGVSDSQLSQFRRGTYPNPSLLLQRIREAFGGESVSCPELGEISLADCAEHKRRSSVSCNSFYVRMYNACRNCPNNGGKP